MHALESNHFNVQFFEAEHVMDVSKTEHDISDVNTLKSEYIRIVPGL